MRYRHYCKNQRQLSAGDTSARTFASDPQDSDRRAKTQWDFYSSRPQVRKQFTNRNWRLETGTENLVSRRRPEQEIQRVR